MRFLNKKINEVFYRVLDPSKLCQICL